MATGCGEAAPSRASLFKGAEARQPPPANSLFPALTGRVVDTAAIIPDEAEERLTAELAGLEQRTGHQFVVVTVTDLKGSTIEDYGLALGNHWGVGRKDVNDGVLLIVAPGARKVRIEVGCGLETALTNAEAKVILDRDVLPRFREGQMVEGIEAGSLAIISEIEP